MDLLKTLVCPNLTGIAKHLSADSFTWLPYLTVRNDVVADHRNAVSRCWLFHTVRSAIYQENTLLTLLWSISYKCGTNHSDLGRVHMSTSDLGHRYFLHVPSVWSVPSRAESPWYPLFRNPRSRRRCSCWAVAVWAIRKVNITSSAARTESRLSLPTICSYVPHNPLFNACYSNGLPDPYTDRSSPQYQTGT